MSYAVRSIFYTRQGEGAIVGRPAVFCRFAGCNLWSGREQDRATAICRFCDTEFVGTDGPAGGRFSSAAELARAVSGHWPGTQSRGRPFVVCTGGEPLLQIEDELVAAFKEHGLEVAVETNGTVLPPPGLDWITVSPKAGSELLLRAGQELKLVFPRSDLPPDTLEGLDFQHFFLQPMDGPDVEVNTHLALRYCLENPRWRLSLQTHKLFGIP
jgi:7-carboxy-7-deazaguanine synthase (Cx14CxxC type)